MYVNEYQQHMHDHEYGKLDGLGLVSLLRSGERLPAHKGTYRPLRNACLRRRTPPHLRVPAASLRGGSAELSRAPSRWM